MTFAEKIPSDEGTDSASEPNRTFAEQRFPTAAPIALMPNVTFAAKFCFDRGLPIGDFAEKVFQACLYPHARQLVTFLRLIPGFFDVDMEFIQQAGRLSTKKQLEELILDFTDDRRNRRKLRSTLNIRISARKMRQVASPYLQDQESPNAFAHRSTSDPTGSANSHSRHAPSAFVRRLSDDDQESTKNISSRPTASKTLRKKLDAQVEITLLQEEVARLIEQRDVLKNAMGIICEPSPRKVRETK
jgi:hypothetical protein